MTALLAALPRRATRAELRPGRSTSLVAGVGLLGAMLVFSIVASLVGGNPATQHLASALTPPGVGGHLLGTDQLGRSVLAWVGAGIRTSFTVSISVVGLSSIFGCSVGILAGYRGRWLDTVLMRLADLQLSVPPLPLFIAASVFISNNMFALVLLISIVGWVPYARLCRARVLANRRRGYVAAARLAGRRTPAIIVLHLLPDLMNEIAVLASLQAGVALLWEAGLSFLGLGLQPPYVSLGFLLAEGKEVIFQSWWVATFPGLALVLLVLGFNLTGDGIRDMFSGRAATATL